MRSAFATLVPRAARMLGALPDQQAAMAWTAAMRIDAAALVSACAVVCDARYTCVPYVGCVLLVATNTLELA